MIKVIYNEPLEVTKEQYDEINRRYAGVCFHRIHEGKYYIKLGLPRYKEAIEAIVNKK